MHQNISKLLHISSDEDDSQDEEPVSQIKVQKQKSKLKLNSFKGDLYSMQQNNNFNDFNSNERDYTYQQNVGHKFTLLDHTIELPTKNREAQSVQSKSQNQTIISHLNNMDLGDQGQQTSKERAKKNMFDLDFDEDEQEQEESGSDRAAKYQGQEKYQNIFIAQEVEGLAVNDEKTSGQADEQKNIEEIVIVIKRQNQTVNQFALMYLKNNERIITNIIRENSGMDYFLPRFDLILKHDLFTILSCKKQMGTKFEYFISTDKNNFSDKGDSYLGKIVGNFKNSVFSLIDRSNKKILCTCRFREEEETKIPFPLVYQVFILNEQVAYDDLMGKDKNMGRGLDELYQVPQNKNKIHYFRNKKPEFDKIKRVFMLNFNQRVSQKSVKNFILEDAKSGREALMFGRGPAELFNLEISAPFNPLLALTIVIPQFASKMLVA